MSIFSLLSAFGVSFCVYLIFQPLKKHKPQRIDYLFIIAAVILGLWSFIMIFTYTVSDLKLMKYLHFASTIAIILISSVLLDFFVSLAKVKIQKHPLLIRLLIYLPALINVIIVTFFYDSITLVKWSHWGWIIIADTSTLLAPFAGALITITFLLSITIIIRWFIKTPKSENTRKLALHLSGFMIISFVPALAEWICKDLMHIHTFPDINHLLGVIWLAGIWYVMLKYQFMDYHSDIVLNELMQSSHELMFIHDKRGRIIFCNPRSLLSLSLDNEEVVDHFLTEFIQDSPDNIKKMTEFMLDKISFNINTSLVSHQDVIPVYWLATPFKTTGWSNNLYLSIIHDKRELEQMAYDSNKDSNIALRLSEIQYRTTLDALSDYLVVTDRFHNIVLYNQALGKYLGEQQKGAFLGHNLFQTVDLINDSLRLSYQSMFEHNHSQNSQEHHSIDGKDQLFEVQRIPIEENEKVHYIVTLLHNLNKQSKVDEIQLRNEKMESLAILAGGIAHDFNNILTGIMGNISIASYKNTDPTIKELLKRAEQSSYRAKNLTSHLLTFSKGGNLFKQCSSLSQALNETAQFILSGSNIKIKTDYHHKVDLVEYDETQINRVFHNIIINAKDAMPGGGILYLSSLNMSISKKQTDLGLMPGSYIVLKIQDEGAGIDKERLSHIFDPFYSTKISGSGLGLSTSYSIIQKHGGMLDVESELNKGTCFSLYLPLSKKDAEQIDKEKDTTLRGSGKILIMDDEEMILQTTGDILTYMGYTVSICRSGEEALLEYKKSLDQEEKYDAIILDLTVPGAKGGIEIIDELHDMDPDVRAIMSTGYTENDKASNYKKMGFTALCTKPFDVNTLATIVAKAIKGDD